MANTLHSRGMLVAETDEKGRVVHVWIKDEGDRYPHPFRRMGEKFSDSFERYRIAGAPREDVTRWLSAQL